MLLILESALAIQLWNEMSFSWLSLNDLTQTCTKEQNVLMDGCWTLTTIGLDRCSTESHK